MDATETPDCESSNPEATLSQPAAETIGVGMMEADLEGPRQDLYLRGSDAADLITAVWSSGTVALTVTGGGSFNTAESGTAGCAIPEAKLAECSAPNLSSILMNGGPGNDTLSISGTTKQIPVELFGGEGDDHVIGGKFSENVLVDGPGDGEDRLRGRGGDDTLFSE